MPSARTTDADEPPQSAETSTGSPHAPRSVDEIEHGREPSVPEVEQLDAESEHDEVASRRAAAARTDAQVTLRGGRLRVTVDAGALARADRRMAARWARHRGRRL